MTQISNATQATRYFTSEDRHEGYYAREAARESAGRWFGRGAERFGLSGAVEQGVLRRLAEGHDPHTGDRLTVRERHNRRVGYDLTFSVGKSLTMQSLLSGDEAIARVMTEAVHETLREMESAIQTRVRTAGANADRSTGNLTAALFHHTTARPGPDGIPDPHLHVHALVLNLTHDSVEGRWKAAQFHDIASDLKYYQTAFQCRVAGKLTDLGYELAWTEYGPELAGIDRATRDKFSQRTHEIETEAARRGISDRAEKGRLGARTRRGKSHAHSLDELKALWWGKLSGDEATALRSIRSGHELPPRTITARDAVEFALTHTLERNSVVPEATVLETALRYAAGHVTPEQVRDELAQRIDLIRRELKAKPVVTTRAVLEQERSMIARARSSRGTCPSLVTSDFHSETLSREQADAVRHLFGSHDGVMLLRGRAGSGKTSMMTEAVAGIESAGRTVFTFAPSAEARDILRREGFTNADTVARLLVDERMQASIRGGVLWVDEASLLSMRQMKGVLDLAAKTDCRVILGGDPSQHVSVERGDAFRILQTHAGLVPAEVRTIRRQSGRYREAVQALSRGETEQGFDQLTALGFVRECGEGRLEQLAKDYADTRASGRTVLVIAPTHREGNAVSGAIRSELLARGQLGSTEHVVTRFVPLDRTEAERRTASCYEVGQVVIFHQNARGHITRGDRLTVVGRDDTGRVMARTADGTDMPLPLDQAARFGVFKPEQFGLRVGDRVRITRNTTSADGKHRLTNGALYDVARITDRQVTFANGWTVDRNTFGHLTHGFVTTSHAAQGKTVDRVLVAMGRESFAAVNQQTLYVAASRGKHSATIYTDDKAALRDAATRSGVRLSAMELVGPTTQDRLARGIETAQRVARYAAQVARTAADRLAHARPATAHEHHGRAS